jgi:putative acetyltransferase
VRTQQLVTTSLGRSSGAARLPALLTGCATVCRGSAHGELIGEVGASCLESGPEGPVTHTVLGIMASASFKGSWRQWALLPLADRRGGPRSDGGLANAASSVRTMSCAILQRAGIRLARASESASLVEVWERSVRATHHFLTEEDITFLRPLVAEELTVGILELWVVTSPDDLPLGFLGLSANAIEALFLTPECRGAGLGRRLVEHAQSLRADALTVTVNEQNGAARSFYERLGFEVEGRSALDQGGRPFPLLHMRRDVHRVEGGTHD